MKELLEYLLKNIVNNPDEVDIEENIKEENGRKYVTYLISANQEDLRIIIGKGGRTIKSLSSILKVKAIKDSVFVDLRVNKPDLQPEIL